MTKARALAGGWLGGRVAGPAGLAGALTLAGVVTAGVLRAAAPDADAPDAPAASVPATNVHAAGAPAATAPAMDAPARDAPPLTAGVARPSAPFTTRDVQERLPVGYDGRQQFVRIRFDEGGFGGFGGRGFRGGRAPMWAHDYPLAESNFLKILNETTYITTNVDGLNVLTADDPDLFKFPIAYIVEVGAWYPTDAEAESLGAYLRKGGFLIVDDFRGRRALNNLELQLERVIPGARLMPLDERHEIFDSFFRVVPDDVLPPYGAEPPLFLALFEDNDPAARIQVVVNYNNDIGDYWEYSDYGYYPIDLSNEAYKLGVNYIVYAYTH